MGYGSFSASLSFYQKTNAASDKNLGHSKYRYLHLVPNLAPLPSMDFINNLREKCLTHHLFLLTARHEIGYLYHKVLEWCGEASRIGKWEQVPYGLGSGDLGLLAARARGYRDCITAVAGGEYRQDRTDAPKRQLRPDSDLAGLYELFLEWYEKVYLIVARARICKLDGCTNLLAPYNGIGRPQEFCCPEHGKIYRMLENNSKKVS